MGETSILSKNQKLILSEVCKSDFLKEDFYFTGGTALSEVYLKHRVSVDLDFFSDKKYDPQSVFTTVTKWSREHNFKIETQYLEPTHIYILDFGKDERLKIDFAYYPYKNVARREFYMNFPVDSKMDIAVNKLLLISSQREQVKDFVDLYFLLQEYPVWDLIEGVRVKFNVKIEPFVLASDFTAVEGFEFMPRMIKSLTLKELKGFFLQKAKEIGKRSVE